MTLTEALEAAKIEPVRHSKMQQGWTMRVDNTGQHWFVNPVTGDMRAFPFGENDRIATDWKVVR